jgi:hypothetical protein
LTSSPTSQTIIQVQPAPRELDQVGQTGPRISRNSLHSAIQRMTTRSMTAKFRPT